MKAEMYKGPSGGGGGLLFPGASGLQWADYGFLLEKTSRRLEW